MTNPRVRGVTIQFPDGPLVVPPLNLRSVRELKSRIVTFTGTLDDMDVVADVLHAALLRNYPEMTMDQVADMVDVGNMGEVMQAVMGVSGLVPKDGASGEAAAPQ
jgi:hypothetical protein